MHNIRIGQAIDIHQLVEGRKLILGGVEIEHTKGLLGHSDADVLAHAIGERNPRLYDEFCPYPQ